MQDKFSRTELLIGKESVRKLNRSKVVIFGLGGVGSYVVEGLARAGIGNFILIDNDNISITNLNRQILATYSTIGKSKVEVARKRILDINKEANVEIIQEFFLPDSKEFFDSNVDYIVDAIDTISAKIEIVKRANKLNIPVISCMGTGNKLDPTRFEVSDIYKTSMCPVAKIMRKELKKKNIPHLKVVYSKEPPITIKDKLNNEDSSKRVTPGSVSFVPSVAGLIIAGEVVKDILK